MGLTPDRTDGPSIEEETQYEDRTADGNPTVDGALRRLGDDLLFKNSLGVHSLLASGGPPSGTAGGDLKGNYPNPTVDKIEGKDVHDLTGITDGQVLKWVAANSRFEASNTPTSGAADTMQVICRLAEESTTSYETVQKFIYGGSIEWGSPNLIEALAWTENASKPGDVRILDTTNALVIVELLAFANTAQAILDLGTVSNIPTGPAVWEVQTRRPSGSPVTIHCETVAIRMS